MGPRPPHQTVAAIVAAFVTFTGGLVAPLSAAHAQTDPRMKEVKSACASGNFERGVKLLADMYVETNDPTAIYNQGRCYQQNAEPERAASRFREYLRKARDLSASERAEVEGFIKEADAEAAARAQRAAAAAPPPAGTPAPPMAPGVPPSAEPTPAAPYGWVPAPQAAPYPAATPYPPAQQWMPPAPAPVKRSRRKGLLIGGAITLGVSYLLTAVVGNALIEAEDADCANCNDVGEAFYVPVLGPWMVYDDEAKEDDGSILAVGTSRKDLNGLAALAGVAQGIGAVLTGIGIAVFAASGGETTTAATATPSLRLVQVTPTPGGAFGSVRGSF
jgi:hypothetical protein